MLHTIQKTKRTPLIGVLLAAALTVGSAIPAQALDFGFEFSNFFGNTNGTVTGRILGLQDNTSNQAASSVIIDSIPGIFSPIGSVPSPGGFGNDVLTWTAFWVNNFSVMNGAITLYDVHTSTGTGGQIFHLSTTYLNGVGFLGEDIDQDGFVTLEENAEDLWLDTDLVEITSLSGSNPTPSVSYSAVTLTLTPFQPVPEPSTMLLLGSGLAGIIAWRTRKIN